MNSLQQPHEVRLRGLQASVPRRARCARPAVGRRDRLGSAQVRLRGSQESDCEQEAVVPSSLGTGEDRRLVAARRGPGGQRTQQTEIRARAEFLRRCVRDARPEGRDAAARARGRRSARKPGAAVARRS
jgi:hypothetical protein